MCERASELNSTLFEMWGHAVRTRGLPGVDIPQVSSDGVLRDGNALQSRGSEAGEGGQLPVWLWSCHFYSELADEEVCFF